VARSPSCVFFCSSKLQVPFPGSCETGEPRVPSRSAHAPLLGFDVPLQRLKWRAPVLPGDSNLRHVPSLGILTPSTSCFALHLAGPVSSRPTLVGFTRSPPSRTGLSTVSRDRSHDALASPLRPPLFRAPELRTGSFSRAFSPLHGSPDFSPGLPPLHLNAPGSVSRSTRIRCFGVFTTRGSDSLGRSRGTRVLPS
jgi:hypothetical protein